MLWYQAILDMKQDCFDDGKSQGTSIIEGKINMNNDREFHLYARPLEMFMGELDYEKHPDL